MSRKQLRVKKNKAELRYYSPVYAAICFGPRSKSILCSKTASRDFIWDRSPFLFVAQTHRKRYSATQDFSVLLHLQTSERGWKDEGNWDWNTACKWLWHDLSCEVMAAVKENTRIFTSQLVPSGQTKNLKYSFWSEGIMSYNASTIRNQERHNVRMMGLAPLCRREYYHS